MIFAMIQHQTVNFTIAQIKAAHAKVKSGADFPNYIQEMKAMGVILYEHFVTDGRVNYYGLNEYSITTEAKWEKREVTKISNINQLKTSLKIHQAGKTNYLAFCKQSAEIGVEKWIVDLKKMTCTYYDIIGNILLVETIPS